MIVNPDNTLKISKSIEAPTLRTVVLMAQDEFRPNPELLDKIAGFDLKTTFHSRNEARKHDLGNLSFLLSTAVSYKPTFLERVISTTEGREKCNYVELGINSRLSLNVLDWISRDETLPSIPANTIRPSQIQLARTLIEQYNEITGSGPMDFKPYPQLQAKPGSDLL